MTNKFIEMHFDEFLHYYYCSPCGGCKDGHPSFWKTVIESPQWLKWREELEKRMKRGKIVKGKFSENVYDLCEVEELGILGEKHFQDFLKFTFKLLCKASKKNS